MRQLTHLNGNLLCAIDTETTGLDAQMHEIIEIAIVPLDSDLKPSNSTLPFHIFMKPEKIETIDLDAMTCNKSKLLDLMQRGIDKFKGVDLFIEWFERFNLPFNKKIVPLGQNYMFDKGFIENWLGPLTYQACFDYHYRDTCVAAQYLNDWAAFNAEKPPFPKVNLSYLASQLNVENPKAHSALNDAIVTADCYRQMVLKGTFVV